MTGMSRWRAASISIRMKSLGSSSRRLTAGSPQPPWPDHREKHITPGHLGVDVFAKIHAKRYGIDVHHYGIVAEVGQKPVEDPAGDTSRIPPPIAEEDFRHRAFTLTIFWSQRNAIATIRE